MRRLPTKLNSYPLCIKLIEYMSKSDMDAYPHIKRSSRITCVSTNEWNTNFIPTAKNNTQSDRTDCSSTHIKPKIFDLRSTCLLSQHDRNWISNTVGANNTHYITSQAASAAARSKHCPH